MKYAQLLFTKKGTHVTVNFTDMQQCDLHTCNSILYNNPDCAITIFLTHM